MMSHNWKRLLSRILVLAMCIGLFAAVPVSAADQGRMPKLADLGGSMTGDQLEAQIGWTNDALPQSTMKTLINNEELHPQRTGYMQFDAKIDEILAPYASADTYTKLQAIYVWLQENVIYTHNGYGYVEGVTNTYDYFLKTYVGLMTYEEGLQKAVPDNVVDHACYALFENYGACYDYASLMALAIRHVGINAYVHTGYWILESNGSTNNHHGWTEIELNGKLYIIDPQRESRYTEIKGSNQNIYFGIPHENDADWRYWAPDTADNAARDAGFLSVTAERQEPSGPVDPPVDPNPIDPDNPPVDPEKTVTITTTVQGNGTVTCDGKDLGDGKYEVKAGDKVHLEAIPGEGAAFAVWWDVGMRDMLLEMYAPYGPEAAWAAAAAAMLSADQGYTFIASEDITLEAVFAQTAELTIVSSISGSVKSDGVAAAEVQEHLVGDQVKLSAEPNEGKSFEGWYDEWGNLLSTDSEYSFEIQGDTIIYALFAGDVFCDITEDDWFYDYAIEAHDRELVKGNTAVTFDPDGEFTRAMAAVLMARIEKADVDAVEAAPFEDVDQENDWFAKEVNWAYANKLVTGRDEVTFDPNATITREEYVALVIRYLNWKGYSCEGTELNYSDVDQVEEYALKPFMQAQEMGLVSGDTEGTLRPKDVLARCEGVKVIVLMDDYMDEHQPAQPENPAD